MKNPFKSIKSKTQKIVKHPITGIVVAATIATATGTLAMVGANAGLARVPMHYGLKILTSWTAYAVTSTVTKEVVTNEWERFQNRHTLNPVPNAPQ